MRPMTVWLLRLLMALLLLFAGEILFWNDPYGRPWLEWPPLLLGYVLLATLLLDLLERYRVRDVWGAMLAVGFVGGLNALLLNPATALSDVPDTLISHAFGAYWLLSLEMVGVLLFLLDSRPWAARRAWVMATFVVGFNWAVWVKWFPVFNAGAYAPVTFSWTFVPALVMLLPAVMLFAWLRGREIDTARLKMTWREALLMATALAVYGGVRALDDTLDLGAWLMVGVVLLIVYAILWFRADTRKPSLLARRAPLTHPAGWGWLVMGVAFFVMGAATGASLPLIEGIAVAGLPEAINQFSLLTVVFTVVGVGWLPLTAAVLGVNAFARQVERAQRYLG